MGENEGSHPPAREVRVHPGRHRDRGRAKARRLARRRRVPVRGAAADLDLDRDRLLGPATTGSSGPSAGAGPRPAERPPPRSAAGCECTRPARSSRPPGMPMKGPVIDSASSQKCSRPDVAGREQHEPPRQVPRLDDRAELDEQDERHPERADPAAPLGVPEQPRASAAKVSSPSRRVTDSTLAVDRRARPSACSDVRRGPGRPRWPAPPTTAPCRWTAGCAPSRSRTPRAASRARASPRRRPRSPATGRTRSRQGAPASVPGPRDVDQPERRRRLDRGGAAHRTSARWAGRCTASAMPMTRSPAMIASLCAPPMRVSSTSGFIAASTNASPGSRPQPAGQHGRRPSR